ncbi:MAG: hypothetical protein J0L92_33440 [Deltaproteobacteria bacterium]|nr:hypothetical protein [Deltaproteobacteria bacterium]
MNYQKPAALMLSTLGVAAGLAFVATQQTTVEAADHLDPPARTNPDVAGADADRNADIADVYAWVRGEGAARTAVFALSFAGPNVAAAGQEVPCDSDVVYQIHIDNNGDTMGGVEPTSTIEMRLGEDDRGTCFYRITGVPGAGANPIVGAVGHTRRVGTTMAHVGLRADAFFFDLVGFRETLMTATLAFESDRDFFALKNTSVMVVEVPILGVSPTDGSYRVWATTSRFGS